MIDKIIKLSEENANYDIVKYGLICLLNGTVSFFKKSNSAKKSLLFGEEF